MPTIHRGRHTAQLDGDFDVFLIGADGRYVLRGDLVDIDKGENLTEARSGQLRVRAIAAVPESDMIVFAPPGPVQAKHTVTVFTDAGGPGVPGRISYISERAEFTPRNVQTAEDRSKLVYRIKVALDNANGTFKSGMPVEAEIVFAR